MFFYLFNSAEFREARRDFRKADRDPEPLLPDLLHPDLHEAHHQVDQKRPVIQRQSVFKEESQIRVCFSTFFNSAEFRKATQQDHGRRMTDLHEEFDQDKQVRGL